MFDRPAAIAARLRAPLLLALALGLAWLAVDLLVYRSGAAVYVAQPQSNTGAVISTLLMVEQQYQPQARNVLVFGDSRVGVGLSSQHAGAGHAGLNIINISVPGSTPRTWYYLWREVDRRGYRVDAIVAGTLYRDPTVALRSNWPLDPAHALPLLGWRDALSFPATFDSDEMQERARHAVVFPALALRQDTLDLLQSPTARDVAIRQGRPAFLEAVRHYGGEDGVMPSLRFSTRTSATESPQVTNWGDATPTQQAQVNAHLSDLVPRAPALTLANDAFLGEWLGAMARLAQDRGIPMLVYPLPRGPYPEVLGPQLPLPASLEQLSQQPGVTVLPADALGELETPDNFHDALHASRAGRQRTSEIVGAHIAALLARDAAP